MDTLTTVMQLTSQGRFADALRTLGPTSSGTVRRSSRDVLRAELLERVGRHGESQSLANGLIRTQTLTAQERAACEFTIARVALQDGCTDSAVDHFQRAIHYAKQAGDLERVCWSQLRLLLMVADRSAPEATASLLTEARTNALRTGNAQVVAALHIYVGQKDAKRGLLKSGARHARIGQEILTAAPNVWLEAVAENTTLGIAILRSEFEVGLAHGERALNLAEQSGSASTIRACLGNLGNLYLIIGEFETAGAYFERALAALPSRGDGTNASLDGLARVRLTQGLTDDCERLLNRIDESIQTTSDRLLNPNRYAQLTRTHLAVREARWAEALASVDATVDFAKSTDDASLKALALLTKAEILQQTDKIDESLAILNSLMPTPVSAQQPEVSAQYERILACALASRGEVGKANRHYRRAKRICESVRSAPGIIELERCWKQSHAIVDESNVEAPLEGPLALAQHVTQGIASLLLHASRPQLVARELVQLFEATSCVQDAVVLSQVAERPSEVIAATEDAPIALNSSASAKRRFRINWTGRDSMFEVIVTPKPDIESTATLNAITVLVNAVHDLDRARADREERATLWPLDELPSENTDAILSGHMRELMNLARRIGPTNVTVLITGESGTGKEILARALHAFSSRAAKPFMPFNCAAVPHEMLESQLFGHRRGAFTGADRDQPGIIRSARDGTLFLDEIGEMGLDLQPKILRFLESGEIAPLGEPGPLTVNVRLIAATNADLDTLVRAGRFREDLFYRLNVFRLPIRPLRERRDEIPALVNAFVMRAAAEFRKGQMRVAEETMEHLLLYPWPGNVRQLLNETRRMVALAEPDSVLAPTDISSEIRATLPPFPTLNADARQLAVPLRDKLLPTLSRIECEMIRLALHDNGGKVDAAAKALGISRKGLYLKRQRLGL